MKNNEKQKITKVKLEEIPRINTFGRDVLASLFIGENYYKEKNKDGIYFTEEELQAIEQKYETGILLNDVFEELKKKKWRINPNTIKHYIQIGQLPRSIETKKGTRAYYPNNFIRHLNIVRFFIENGREDIKESLSILRKVGKTDLEILQGVDTSYEQWGMDFIQMLYSGIHTRLHDGISNGEEAVRKAFATDNKKMGKYLKRLRKIEALVEKLESEIKDLEKECEIRRLNSEDK